MEVVSNRYLGPYLEQQILSASPLELVNISYQAAIQAIRDARRFLVEGNIAERSRSISLGHSILAELYRALDFSAGDGVISRELGRLYDYMMRRLLEANAKQTDAPLAEVLSLLCSIGEAWAETARKGTAPVAAPQPWQTSELAAEQSHYSFSF